MDKLKVNLLKNMIKVGGNPFFKTNNRYFDFITTFIAYSIIAGFLMIFLLIVVFGMDTGLNLFAVQSGN